MDDHRLNFRGGKEIKGKWRTKRRHIAVSCCPRHSGQRTTDNGVSWREGCQDTAGHGMKRMRPLLYSGAYGTCQSSDYHEPEIP